MSHPFSFKKFIKHYPPTSAFQVVSSIDTYPATKNLLNNICILKDNKAIVWYSVALNSLIIWLAVNTEINDGAVLAKQFL